jgi:hypothetical protein
VRFEGGGQAGVCASAVAEIESAAARIRDDLCMEKLLGPNGRKDDAGEGREMQEKPGVTCRSLALFGMKKPPLNGRSKTYALDFGTAAPVKKKKEGTMYRAPTLGGR